MLKSYTPDVPLSAYNTFHIGGDASFLLEAHTKEELQRGIEEAHEAHMPLLVLGGGSNVLISDDGINACVIINKVKGTTFSHEGETVYATVSSGEMLDDFVADCVAKGYWGLENLSHIPGTVGATPIQNVGAYGVEVSSYITSVNAINTHTGIEKVFTTKECGFEYRNSYFKTIVGKQWVIVSVTFALSTIARPQVGYADLAKRFEGIAAPVLSDIRNAVIDIRSKKFPNWQEVGTAGSFFKNPVIATDHFNRLKNQYPDLPGYVVNDEYMKVPLGWVLDKICNLKGVTHGYVGSYSEQALVLVAAAGARASDVNDFARMISETVFLKTQIMIEHEVTHL